MAAIESPSEKKSLTQLGTRVNEIIELDLVELARKERRSMSSLLSIMLDEYVPIRKQIVENKQVYSKFTSADGYLFESDVIANNPEIFQLILTKNKDSRAESIFLNEQEVVKLAANLLTFLIDVKING